MLILTDVQKVALSVQPVDAAGNPAAVKNPLVWAVVGANPGIVQVQAAADGLSAEVVTQGPLGTCQVTVTDVDDAAKPIVGVLDIQVVGSEAVSLNVNAAAPESRLPAPEPVPAPAPEPAPAPAPEAPVA